MQTKQNFIKIELIVPQVSLIKANHIYYHPFICTRALKLNSNEIFQITQDKRYMKLKFL